MHNSANCSVFTVIYFASSGVARGGDGGGKIEVIPKN